MIKLLAANIKKWYQDNYDYQNNFTAILSYSDYYYCLLEIFFKRFPLLVSVELMKISLDNSRLSKDRDDTQSNMEKLQEKAGNLVMFKTITRSMLVINVYIIGCCKCYFTE